MLVAVVLQLADVITPLLQRLSNKLSQTASFLLVQLLGRSLGLVYKGVMESFKGRGKKGQSGDGQNPKFGW